MKVSVIGASGYTGAQLVHYLHKHPKFEVNQCFVSSQSQDANKKLNELHGFLAVDCDYPLVPLASENVENVGRENDAVFLALPHEASHEWVSILATTNTKVLDLSAAYRLSDMDIFAEYYGFKHEHQALQQSSVYGLVEWNAQAIANANVIAVPGCYPTASLLALKPLIENKLTDTKQLPVINAVSGVSGAGRKASLTTSFYEVSLNPYGVHTHRHIPEIEEHAGSQVIFTPHLGNFKRGILATTTVFVQKGVTKQDIETAYTNAYQDSALVRLKPTWPKVDDVAHTAYCDLHWEYDENKSCVIIGSAIDNLLKGASTQAIQCANLAFGLPDSEGLV